MAPDPPSRPRLLPHAVVVLDAGKAHAMRETYLTHVRRTLEEIRADGFYKTERLIRSPQSSAIDLAAGRRESTRSMTMAARKRTPLST